MLEYYLLEDSIVGVCTDQDPSNDEISTKEED